MKGVFLKMDLQNLANRLWVDKYAPTTLDEMVVDDNYLTMFKSYVQNKEIPNLLLSGIQGSGKTTAANIFIKNITSSKYDYLVLNGSLNNGIDTIRETIVGFSSTPPMGGSKHKIILIDEADHLTVNAQTSLRSLIEKYQNNVRYIFTCNYPKKIIEALHSRFTTFEFRTLPKDELFQRLLFILNEEKIKYDEADVHKLIDIYYPDVRKTIHTLQKLSIGKTFTLQNITNVMSDEDKLVEITLKYMQEVSKNYYNNVYNYTNTIKQLLKNDYSIDYNNVYKRLADADSTALPQIIIINDYALQHNSAVIPSMNFLAMLYRMYEYELEIAQINLYGNNNPNPFFRK